MELVFDVEVIAGELAVTIRSGAFNREQTQHMCDAIATAVISAAEDTPLNEVELRPLGVDVVRGGLH